MGNVFMDPFMGMHFIFVYERLVFGLYDHDIASYIPDATEHCLLLIKYTYLKFNTLSQARSVWLIYIHVCRTVVRKCVCTCLSMCVRWVVTNVLFNFWMV